ncbi:MAG: O-antigen ligase family protein [bacterium]|nr:O-antigen ligase family protein [bacterium]
MPQYLINPFLVLLFFLYPFVSLQLVYGDLNIPLSDIVALGLGFIFLWYILGKIFLQQTFSQLRIKGISAYLIFLLIALVSISNSLAADLSLKYFFRFPLFYFVTYYLAAGTLLIQVSKTKPTFLQWNHLFCISIFLVSLISIISSVYRIWLGNFWGIFEIPYLTGNHKTIAITLVVGLPLLIGMIKNIKGLPRLFYLITIVSCIVGIFLSASKAAWLTGLVVFILWGIKLFDRFNLVKSAVMIFALLILFGIGIVGYLMSSNQPEVIRAEVSRTVLGIHAIQLFASHPFIGSGIGNFAISLETYSEFLLKLGYPGLITRDAHGLVFKLLSETGLLGLSAFATFYFVNLYWLYQNYKNHKQTGNIFAENMLYGAISGLIALLVVNSFFGTDTYTPRFWFPLMFIIMQGAFAERQELDATRN